MILTRKFAGKAVCSRRSSPWSIVLVAIASFVLAVATLYPGWYSFDSSWQLLQARTRVFADLQPPGMAFAWAGLLDMGLPPGALLVVHLAALATGAALVGLSIRRPHGMVLPLVLLWPPFLAVFGHLWIDVSMAAGLMLATGWIAWTRAVGRPQLGWLAALPLAYVVGVRHNAVFAVPPLLFLLVTGARWSPRSARARVALVVALTVGAYGAWALLSKMVVGVHAPVWTTLAIWDLSAVSVASGEMLLPAGMRGPGLTVEELRPLVNPDTSMNILTGTRSGVNPGVREPLSPEVERELRVRWLCLPFTHGVAWLRHRAGVTWSLLGPQRTDKFESLFILPHVIALRDNPAIRVNDTVANSLLLQAVRAMRDTPWCTPLLYLLLAIAAAGLALRPDFSGDRALVLSLSLGAWLVALPLAVLAPAAEWRYLLWPMMSAAIALSLAICGGGKPVESLADSEDSGSGRNVVRPPTLIERRSPGAVHSAA